MCDGRGCRIIVDAMVVAHSEAGGSAALALAQDGNVGALVDAMRSDTRAFLLREGEIRLVSNGACSPAEDGT